MQHTRKMSGATPPPVPRNLYLVAPIATVADLKDKRIGEDSNLLSVALSGYPAPVRPSIRLFLMVRPLSLPLHSEGLNLYSSAKVRYIRSARANECNYFLSSASDTLRGVTLFHPLKHRLSLLRYNQIHLPLILSRKSNHNLDLS